MSSTNGAVYRGYIIERGPAYDKHSRWTFAHVDWDGAPQNTGEGPADRRYGSGTSIKDCVDQIDEQISEAGGNPFVNLFDAMGLPAIQPIPTIGLRPVAHNERLWGLHAKDVAGTLTAAERAEYDELCARLEAECDDANERQTKGAKL